MSNRSAADRLDVLLSEPYAIKRLFSLERMSAEEERALRIPARAAVAPEAGEFEQAAVGPAADKVLA